MLKKTALFLSDGFPYHVDGFVTQNGCAPERLEIHFYVWRKSIFTIVPFFENSFVSDPLSTLVSNLPGH